MYPYFLTSLLTFWKGKQDHYISWKLIPKSAISHYVVLTLETLIPATEECIKLLDRLSEPSDHLIHHISHPSEEDISSELNNSCFICI